MCAYFSKSEDETSEAMKQAAKGAFNSNKTNIETDEIYSSCLC